AEEECDWGREPEEETGSVIVCFRDWQLNEAVLHVLVADRGGSSFVAELSASKEWHFTDNAGKPQILTNHALFKYPDTSAFPPVPATDEYDSCNRYRRLDSYAFPSA
ncbi:MAG: hypothetical protein WC406_02765, partial [Methanoregula sp.]